MIARVGRSIVAPLLLVLWTGEQARADLLPYDLYLAPSALSVGSLIYGHLNILGGSPEEVLLRRLKGERTRRLDPRFRDRMVEEAEELLEAPRPRGLPGESAPSTAHRTHRAGPIVRPEEEVLALLDETPPHVLAMVDRLSRIADTTLFLALNLHGILLGETRPRWDDLPDPRRGLKEAIEEAGRKRAVESVAARINTTQRLATIDRIGRSLVKVLLGLAIGMGLWTIVRWSRTD